MNRRSGSEGMEGPREMPPKNRPTIRVLRGLLYVISGPVDFVHFDSFVFALYKGNKHGTLLPHLRSNSR